MAKSVAARLLRLMVAVLAVVGLGSIIVITWLLSQGIGTKRTPGPLETAVARRLRSYAIPAAARRQRNPVPAARQAIADGMHHFADHCATCHANDGSGHIEVGEGLSPPAPDMRREPTQGLSDGELFYIIENGVRFTGMPAWGTGTPDGEAASWRLVHFIRHLPRLTESEVEQMKALNPRSADEWRDEENIRHFLEGESAAPGHTPPAHEHGGRE
jgi:mono/diheme cytochrome c family protein